MSKSKDNVEEDDEEDDIEEGEEGDAEIKLLNEGLSPKINHLFGVTTVIMCLIFICLSMFALGQNAMCKQIVCPDDNEECGLVGGNMYAVWKQECVKQDRQTTNLPYYNDPIMNYTVAGPPR